MSAGKSELGDDKLSPCLTLEWYHCVVRYMLCCHFCLSPCALPQFKGLRDGIWYKAAPVRGDNWLSAQPTAHVCVTATCTDLPSSFKSPVPSALLLLWTAFHRITQSLLKGTLLVISFLLAIPGAVLYLLASVPHASCSHVSSSSLKKSWPSCLG